MEHGARLRQQMGGTMGRQADKKLFGRIWPNGNFSLGTGPVGHQALELDGADEIGLARFGDSGNIQEAVASLISSNALNSHTECEDKDQRGLKGITGFGQQMIRSACYLLERDYGNQDLCFATLTVPTLSRPARARLAQNWSELVRQFLQFVSRRLSAAGRPTKVVGCSEIQTARLQGRGEGYLHLHAVWPSHSNSASQIWAVEWSDLRAWWERALVRLSGEKLPHHPRVELAPVKVSAERYMGKYLSKGSGECLDEFMADLGQESVPPSWWFMTADMRHQVKRETAKGPNTGSLLDAVIQTALEDGLDDIFEWIRPVMVTFTDRPVHIGWCGRLKADTRDDLLSLLAPLLALPS